MLFVALAPFVGIAPPGNPLKNPLIIIPPKPCVVVSGSVLAPTYSAVAPGANKSRVPLTVIVDPPGIRVCELITNSDPEAWVMLRLLNSRIGGVLPGLSAIGTLDPPTTIAVPCAGSETKYPENIIAGAPGVIVCMPMKRSEAGPRVIVPRPCIMKVAGRDAIIIARSGNEYIDPPIAIPVPELRSETGVPEIITAGAPGIIVRVPMIRVEPEPRLNGRRP